MPKSSNQPNRTDPNHHPSHQPLDLAQQEGEAVDRPLDPMSDALLAELEEQLLQRREQRLEPADRPAVGRTHEPLHKLGQLAL